MSLDMLVVEVEGGGLAGEAIGWEDWFGEVEDLEGKVMGKFWRRKEGPKETFLIGA